MKIIQSQIPQFTLLLQNLQKIFPLSDKNKNIFVKIIAIIETEKEKQSLLKDEVKLLVSDKK